VTRLDEEEAVCVPAWWLPKGLSCPALAVAVTVVMVVTPAASASRAPTANERNAIVIEIDIAPDTAAVRGRFDVRDVRISTVRTPSVRWGRASLVPKPGASAEGATAIVGRFGRRWLVVDVGTSGVGCWLEARVRRDLRITGCA
jgi:hypothetical protein